MKTLSNFNFKNKTVLLRSDLNSEVINGKVSMSERIKQSAETIKELKKKKAKVVVIAHQGRKGQKDFTSLNQHAKLLNKITKVKFVNDIIGKKAIEKIKYLKQGGVLILENIRSLKEEFNPGKNKLITKISPLIDIYINDAFSVSHRKQTSIVSFPKYIKQKGVGRLMEKELKGLKKIRMKKSLYILGGVKSKGNVKLLGKHVKVLATGLFDTLCLVAKGKKLGKQKDSLKKDLYLVKNIKKHLKNIKTSVDFAVEEKGKRKEISLEDLPSKKRLLDIGSKTIKNHIEEIKKHKIIFMKGPVGYYEDKRFSKGTVALLKVLAKHKGFVILGGGNLNSAITKYKINKKSFNHVSLAGGALISYLAGEKLPGLEVLG